MFWCVINRPKGIDTSISFLNHFLLKRDIKSVTLRLALRNLSGNLIREENIEISNYFSPKKYVSARQSILIKAFIVKNISIRKKVVWMI